MQPIQRHTIIKAWFRLQIQMLYITFNFHAFIWNNGIKEKYNTLPTYVFLEFINENELFHKIYIWFRTCKKNISCILDLSTFIHTFITNSINSYCMSQSLLFRQTIADTEINFYFLLVYPNFILVNSYKLDCTWWCCTSANSTAEANVHSSRDNETQLGNSFRIQI